MIRAKIDRVLHCKRIADAEITRVSEGMGRDEQVGTPAVEYGSVHGEACLDDSVVRLPQSPCRRSYQRIDAEEQTRAFSRPCMCSRERFRFASDSAATQSEGTISEKSRM